MHHMDKVTEILKRAAGAVDRSEQTLVNKAEELLARETAFEQRVDEAFAPHHSTMDHRFRQMDVLESSLGIVTTSQPAPPKVTPPAPDVAKVIAQITADNQEEPPASAQGEEFHDGKS